MTRTVLRWIKCATLVGIVLSSVRQGSGQILASSNFETGPEGWTAYSYSGFCTAAFSRGAQLATTWSPVGGAPGGFVRTPDGADSTFWRAPASFGGDRSAALGGSISFEVRLGTTDADVFYAEDDVLLIGGGLTLIADLPATSRDSWGNLQVPLIARYWRVGTCTGPTATTAQLSTVLGSLQELLIRGEHVFGAETNDLDSVTLSATQIDDSCLARWEERDLAGPSGRWRHAGAVDTDRNVLVLFGSDTGETDTWEYDLATDTWTRVVTSIGPSRRGGHAMAYDAARGRIVLSGGGYLGANAEVWEYDVTTNRWTQAPSLPQARSGHSMAFDSQRQTMVLYGGLAAGTASATDVLERSPGSATWTARPATTNPGAQIGYAMAYDPVRQRTVLVGGGTTSLTLWEWDGVEGLWNVLTPTGTAPGTRSNPAAIYDNARQRLIIAGGEGTASTWEFNGASWTQRANLPTGGRDEHVMVFDPLNQRVLVHGGLVNSAGTARELLAFNGSTNQWTTVWSAASCSPRDLFGMIYDEVGERALLYGGGLLTRPGVVRQIGSGVFAFSGGAWTTPTVSGSPGTRWGHPAVYDSRRRVMIVYGGKVGEANSTATARRWELDLATGVWTDRGNQPPGPRFDHAAAYDRVRHQLIIHGGRDDLGNRLGDTWVLDLQSNQWTQVPASAPSPGLRSVAGMVFDENRGVAVLFGGLSGPTNAARYENSVWEWNGSVWVNATPASGSPPARFWPQMTYDPVRRRVVMYSGVMNFYSSLVSSFAAQPYRDLWEWDGTAWTRLWLESGPAPITLVGAGSTYDRQRNRIVHFGGSSFTNAGFLGSQTFDLILPPPICGSPSPCNPADITGVGGPPSSPDGLLTGDDFVAFIAAFAAGAPLADITGIGGPPAPRDTLVTGDDFNAFVAAFAAGCP